MKKVLQEMLYLDEKTEQFSTSKFLTMISFYFVEFAGIKEFLKTGHNSILLEVFLAAAALYFGRRLNLKTKNIESIEKSNEP